MKYPPPPRDLSGFPEKGKESYPTPNTHTNLLFIATLLLEFNSNIWPNMTHLPDLPRHKALNLECELSVSVKVKCDGAIRMPIYIYSY